MIGKLLKLAGLDVGLFELSAFSVAVLLFLLLMSIVSWSIIVSKIFLFSFIKKKSSQTLKNFKKTQGIVEARKYLRRVNAQNHERIFNDAVAEVGNYLKSGVATSKSFSMGNSKAVFSETLERSINKNIRKEMLKFEKNLGLLATISSSSPFIGLFGTVVGVMVSFRNIAVEGASSLAVVAPGISEALLATGMGLFVSIPALIFFNFFRTTAKIIAAELDVFGLEAINLIIVNSHELK